MERIGTWLAMLTCAFLCTFTFAMAESEVSEVNIERRIPIGSRQMAFEQTEDLEQTRDVLLHIRADAKHIVATDEDAHVVGEEQATLLADEESTDEPQDGSEMTLFANNDAEGEEEAGFQPLSCKAGVSKLASMLSYDSFPYCVHHPMFVSPGGYSVELEDGSIWRVEPSDAYYVAGWAPYHDVIILPGSWLSYSPNFYFYNVQTRQSVTVTMKMGPFYDSLFTRWILAINYGTGEVWLDDGSHFYITIDDNALFQEWRPNDTIIVGSNAGMAAYSWPNILINVNTYNPLRKDPNSWKGNPLYVQARWIY
ncbi:MAG: hypothetical protein Q8K75_11205 [Chlamydiales bacterium]|nr:hypothetical protein [Chlamydiales bacterium]